MDPTLIGVFDSGVGGLTVVRELERVLPGRPLIYLGDTARVPYGTKSRPTVERYAREAARFLDGHGVSLLVVACNTASAVALDEVARDGRPAIGVIEPGAARAASVSAQGRIGVIGTRATVASGAYEAAIQRHRPEARVTSLACPLFVPLAEEGWVDGPIARGVAERYLEPLQRAEIDTIVLGCTHYPLLREVVAEVMGQAVAIVDSATATAERVAESVAASPPSALTSRFYVTDLPSPFRSVAERFLGRPLEQLERVRIDED